MFRFVHTADIHLDSPLQSLALRDLALAELVGCATRQALVRIVDLCLEEKVHALMIAGDLYDGDQGNMKTANFLVGQMQRLTDAGISVFIVRGNHDARARLTNYLSFPPGVHVFGANRQEPILTEQGAAIHGTSFSSARESGSLLSHYGPPIADHFNIGLLHTSLTGAEGHDPYAPCSLSDLTGHGFQYWGLGHIHKRSVHLQTRDCSIIMPGIPQGRHINEAGPKSVTLVTVPGDGPAVIEERITSLAQFERLFIDVTAIDNWDDLYPALTAELNRAKNGITAAWLIARLHIQGKADFAWQLRRDQDHLLAVARDAAHGLPDAPKLLVEKIDIETRLPDDCAQNSIPLMELRQLIEQEVHHSPDFLEMARGHVEKMQRELPSGIRDCLGQTDADLDRIARELASHGCDEVLAWLNDSGDGT